MPRLWAQGRLGDRAEAASKLRQTLVNYLPGGHRLFAPFHAGLLAELDAGGPNPNEALPQIDAAIALAQETGDRWSDSMLHRIRGEMLLKRDPANPAPAEEAANRHRRRETALNAQLRTARGAIARQALSIDRPAHAVLAPALEGFAPTPEMREIAEAQTLIKHFT